MSEARSLPIAAYVKQTAGSALGITAITWLLRAKQADTIEALLIYLPLVICISLICARPIALVATLAAALTMDLFFVPPETLAVLESPDGWLSVSAFLGASIAATHYAVTRRRQHREREEYIVRLRENEAALEQRVRERTAALAVAEERLRLAARATNDALWDWDISANVLWWNDAFAALVGPDTRPSLDAWRGLIHPDDATRVTDGMALAVEGSGDVWREEYRIRRANGKYAWVLDRGFVMRGEDGKARRMTGAMMDITERKHAERMKSEFVSFVSHQLRTPLAGMSWMLELAADTSGLPKDAADYIAEARESASRLVTLVNDLLDIARLESGRAVAAPERLDLAELTGSVLREIQTLIADKRHALTVDADSSAAAWADPQLVRQVVGNLLSNAIKYTPTGGKIAVSIRRARGHVQWAVADTGVGIPRAAQARLFERFFRADNAVVMEVEGTGLGLHLVRLIVEQAGGRVWCESEEGRGSIFSFTLPAAGEGATA